MAQYKVPQDVEADDKLLGPFSFRQFVYLLICGGLVAIAVGLFQIFPLLVIVPLPPLLLFGALALPIKKDQPMETYLAALVSYYLKPRTRKWEPGHTSSNINIMAPKIENDDRRRQISGEEATHRLSFLADIVDTEGYAIKGVAANSMQEDLRAEAETVKDMFETNHFDDLADSIMRDENDRHAEVMREMREAIDKNESLYGKTDVNEHNETKNNMFEPAGASSREEPKEEFDPLAKFEDFHKEESDVVVQPDHLTKAVENANEINENQPKSSIIELSNNPSYSVATIAKEANRINNKEEGEVFISLH
ncbi:PrgI family protein [Candidatus Saccharibacteria bacterium]|nr:PrgI family protein [Candidatus Saccharibacteria bacterium]